MYWLHWAWKNLNRLHCPGRICQEACGIATVRTSDKALTDPPSKKAVISEKRREIRGFMMGHKRQNTDGFFIWQEWFNRQNLPRSDPKRRTAALQDAGATS